jgi:hypothetical protein
MLFKEITAVYIEEYIKHKYNNSELLIVKAGGMYS